MTNKKSLKYFSYTDQSNLTIDDLINFSPYHLKTLINELNEQEIKHKTNVLNGLEDTSLRSYHITIEQNLWLKELLLRKIDKLKTNKIELNLDKVSYIGGLKLFLEPYLKPILPLLINQLLANSEVKLLFNILNESDLFL